MNNAIQLESISKTYRIPSIYPWQKAKEIIALKDVNFSCPKSKVTCLLGPNGAGKTTIIKILAGLVLNDKGKIITTLESNHNNLPLNIGLATPNDRSFYWRLTGRQNLEFFASLYNIKGKQKKNEVSKILSEVKMDANADKPFRLYSAGMKQRLILARALLGNPEILLLDEPTAHIDPIAKEEIHKLIKDNFIDKKKITVLMCTHDLNEAQKLANHIVLLDKGEIIAQGTETSLRSMINPHHSFTIGLSQLPKKGWDKKLKIDIINHSSKKIDITIKNKNDIVNIIEAIIASNGKITGCMEQKESLLEIFTRLSNGDS